MASELDFVAKATLTLSPADGVVRVNPTGTNYELHLSAAAMPALEAGTVVRGHIRAKARKLMTVPSGGNFISPILGTPRTIQGRVKYAQGSTLVVHAGCPVIVELPAEDHAIDQNNGPITVGAMVNVIVHPGVSFELAKSTVGV